MVAQQRSVRRRAARASTSTSAPAEDAVVVSATTETAPPAAMPAATTPAATTAESRRGRRGAPQAATHGSPDTPTPAQRRGKREHAPKATTRASQKALPAVAPCAKLDALRALTAEEARDHVNVYLQSVMPREQADAFEAPAYRWELHLVDMEQLRLVRGVDLDTKKVRRYRTAISRGAGFPPLVGLGGEGENVAAGVLLCDGYHRAMAIRNASIHYVWMWLAVGMWPAATARVPAGASVGA